MELRQLEYFVAVAEELNFTRAAARCHVVQSALSYQISRLEREHAVTLFERTSRSVRLAPAGELLLPRARSVLAELDLTRSELAALTGLVRGRLRLGIIGVASQVAPLIDRTLAEFHHRHPAVEITIEDTGSRHMADDIRDGILDIGFVGLFSDQLPPDVAHHLLAVEPLVAIVPPEHPLSDRRTIAIAELAETTAFVEMRTESGLRHQVDAAFSRAGVTRTVAFELSSSQNVIRFVTLGFGAALVPQSAATRSEVTALVLDDPQAQHPISLIHRHPAPAAPSAKAFLTLLGELAADDLVGRRRTQSENR